MFNHTMDSKQSSPDEHKRRNDDDLAPHVDKPHGLPDHFSPQQIIDLQQTIGNQAVQRLYQTESVIQRDVFSVIRAKKQFRQFIIKAVQYGMPVKFLGIVLGSTTIDEGSENLYKHSSVFANVLELTKSTLQTIQTLSPLTPIGTNQAVDAAYHEATHAYLKQGSKNKGVAAMVKKGTSYYKNAPLKGGTKADDAERVFHEAAGEYVGHRVFTWWSAFAILSKCAAGKKKPDLIPKYINFARKKYNAEMKKKVFGYQEKGGKELHTKKKMFKEMKKFLDKELLENKISDDFDSNPGFVKLIATAMKRVQKQAP